jgi:hypothetical protein
VGKAETVRRENEQMGESWGGFPAPKREVLAYEKTEVSSESQCVGGRRRIEQTSGPRN